MSGTTYAIGEIIAFLVGATLIGLLIGWIAGRASRPPVKQSVSDLEARTGRLEHRLATLRKTATAAGMAVPEPKPVVKPVVTPSKSPVVEAGAKSSPAAMMGSKPADQPAAAKTATPVAVGKDAAAAMGKGAPEAGVKAGQPVPAAVEAGKGKRWRRKETTSAQPAQQSDELKDRLAALDTQLADLEQRLATFKQS